MSYRDELLKMNTKKVSKCFKYHNYYFKNESWWIYVLVTGVSQHGNPIVFLFQKDCFGTIEVKSGVYRDLTDFIPISSKVFWKEYQKIIDELTEHIQKRK